MKHIRSKTKGFTMIELMVVVVILGILAAMIVPVVTGKDDRARVQVAKSDMKAIANALELYRMDNFHYPSTDEGLEALVKRPSNAPNWAKEGYLKSTPKDPWGNTYIYLSPGLGERPFDIISYGADAKEGGEGINSDISLEEVF